MEAVTQTYTQLTRQNFALFQDGNIPALLETLNDNVEWISHGPEDIFPWAGTRTGKKEVAEFFATLDNEVDFLAFEPREFIEQNNKVVVLGHSEVRIKKNDKRMDNEWVMVFTYKNGKLARYQEFEDTYKSYVAYTN